MLLLILKVNSQHFLRPCAKLKSDIKKLNLELGSQNNLAQHGKCPIFFT